MKNIITVLFAFLLLPSTHFAETPYDFDGDGKTDFGVIRPNQFSIPPNPPLDWYIHRSSDNSLFYIQWGQNFSYASSDPLNGDEWTPADFDGDEITDIAVWRRSTRQYFILNSFDNSVRIEAFGQNGDDVRAVGDYDGDMLADLAVYRVETTSRKGNAFYVKKSANNPTGVITIFRIGSGNAKVYRGDFNADGALDYCVRGGNVFSLALSSGGSIEYITWGIASDAPIAGDVDGDNRTDFVVARNIGGTWRWYILERDGGGTGTTNPIVWGTDTEYPFGGDYDGDGRDDIGVIGYLAPNLVWKVRRSSNGSQLAFAWGLGNDYPLAPALQ